MMHVTIYSFTTTFKKHACLQTLKIVRFSRVIFQIAKSAGSLTMIMTSFFFQRYIPFCCRSLTKHRELSYRCIWLVTYVHVTRITQTVRALPWFIVVWCRTILPKSKKISQLLMKQPWRVLINSSRRYTIANPVTTTKQRTSKLCVYYMGFIIYMYAIDLVYQRSSCVWPQPMWDDVTM